MSQKSTPLEDTIETHVVNRTKALGGMALKGDVPGRRFLDRICILPAGVTMYVECKRPKRGRFSKHQLETIRRLVELGHIVLTPKTKAEVDEAFDKIAKHTEKFG